MPEFMADIQLRNPHSEAFMRLIPEQREMVNTLMLEGKVSSYCLSSDRTHLWITVIAEDSEEAELLIQRFPLFRFMDVRLHALLFHNSNSQMLSHISLN